MNSLLEPVESHLDGTVIVHRVTEPFEDHEELMWTVDEAGLKLSDLFPELQPGLADPTLILHPTIYHDQGEAQRDPVSGENILHFDGSCEPMRPDASLVVARLAERGAPSTRFVSTTGFLALARSLGIFQNFDPADVDSMFGYSAYYSQVQPFWFSLKPDDPRLHEVFTNDLRRFNATTREELVRNLDNDPFRGKRRFPLVSPHSITGQDSIMIDAGYRHIELVTRLGADHEIDEHDLLEAFIKLRLLLADTVRLEAEKLSIEVAPKTGFAVAFPREGLHNQQPPDTEEAKNAKRRMSVLALVAFTAPEYHAQQH